MDQKWAQLLVRSKKKRFSVCSTHIIICVIFSNEFYDFSVLLLNFFDFFGVFYGIFMTHY
jgi:hypothetical protein